MENALNDALFIEGRSNTTVLAQYGLWQNFALQYDRIDFGTGVLKWKNFNTAVLVSVRAY